MHMQRLSKIALMSHCSQARAEEVMINQAKILLFYDGVVWAMFR